MSIARQYQKAKASKPAPREPAPVAVKTSRKGIGGRPRKADKLVAVTLRLHPDVIARYQAQGRNWRARMAEAIASYENPANRS